MDMRSVRWRRGTYRARHRLPSPVRLVTVHFLGFRAACARSDAIGPRSRFGVLGFRKSLPACEASRLDVVMLVCLSFGFERLELVNVIVRFLFAPRQWRFFGGHFRGSRPESRHREEAK